MVQLFIANTDNSWFDFLSLELNLTEVNFWWPGETTFRALEPGELLVFRLKAGAIVGTADAEVSPKRCERFVAASRQQGGNIAITLYPGATHGFDDPGAKRQSIEANAAATEDAVEKALKSISRHLGRP